MKNPQCVEFKNKAIESQSILMGYIQDLEKRLSPVLRSDEMNPEVPPNPPPLLVPMAQAFYEIWSKNDMLCGKIRQMLDLMEI